MNESSQIKSIVSRKLLADTQDYLRAHANFLLDVARRSAPEIHLKLASKANTATALADELEKHKNITFQYQLPADHFNDLDLRTSLEIIVLWLQALGGFTLHEIDVTIQRHLKNILDDVADGAFTLSEEEIFE